MMTLKDIKVSKNRIPVQNALWLRPLNGKTYKLYYPSGGNWKEVTVETGEDVDSTLSKRVEELEKGLKKTDEEVAKIEGSVQELSTRISRELSLMSSTINILSSKMYVLGKTMSSVITTIESMVTSVVLPINFSISSYYNRWLTRTEMSNLGFDDLIFRSIYDNYCETAVISGVNYAITYEYDPIQEAFPGYGGPITLTGPTVTDPVTGEKYRNVYRIAVEVWEDSGDSEAKWMYKITTDKVPGGEAYLVGEMKSNSSKKAYAIGDDELILESGITRLFADESLASPVEEGVYTGLAVVTPQGTVRVPDFTALDGVYYETIYPVGESVYIGYLTSDSSKEAYVTIGEGDSVFDLRNGNKIATDESENIAVDGSYTGAGEVYTDYGGNCIINSFDVIGGLVKNIDMSEL